jgi:hypothetical protein
MPSRHHVPKKLIKPLPEGITWDRVDFIRHCPECGKEQRHKRRDHAIQMLRLNTSCNSCGTKKRGARNTGIHRGVSVSYFENRKKDAKSRGYAFEITIDDVADLLEEQMHLCALTGLPVLLDKCSPSGSIDRIENKVGYTKDNIQITTKEINMLRGSFTMEKFVELCELVTAS